MKARDCSYHVRLGSVIAVAVGIAVAGTLVWVDYLGPHSEHNGPVRDGPTLDEALSEVSPIVLNQSGGSWTLFGVYGIAAPDSFDPTALTTANNNKTVNACGAAFDGLTIWNGSIPTFSGTFDSGTAPFWQFVYFSNASQQVLVATSVNFVPRVFAPIPFSSECAQASQLAYQPWHYADWLAPLSVDSPVLASSAWSFVGENWTGSHPRSVETFVIGPNYWAEGTPQGIIVHYWTCGQVGVAGKADEAGAILDGTGATVSGYIGYISCTADGGGPYSLQFGPGSNSSFDSALQVDHSFQVDQAGFYDGWGLVTWMSNLTLRAQNGSILPSVAPVCSKWVSNVSACTSGSGGWYALLLSATGEWLDSYGLRGGSPSWTFPDVSVVSNQQLVIVLPQGEATGNLTLSVSSTTPLVTLSGSATV